MQWRKYVEAGISVAVVVGVLRAVSVEHIGVAAPLLLLNIVIIARFRGMAAALFAGAVAAAAYSYYFLPPAGFAIEQPDDWIAFITFIVTAVVAGELASRAERRAAEAQAGRGEIERLYQELQAAFDRASEAEAARRNEQLKAALLDALTHNLRTPLTAIKAGVTALLGVWDRHTELSAEGRQELLHVIDEESDRLNRFIEGLSNEGHAATSPIHLRAVQLSDVVGSALVRAENVTRDHQLEVDVSDRLPRVLVEQASIIEVIYMLLDNASKYSPVGTTITIGALVWGDRHVKLTVGDHGPGIAPEFRERVFERFFRIPSRESHDRRRRGIGLGLPIARKLIETQAGQIWIEDSETGHGTSVAVTLPVALDAESAEPPQPASAAAR